MIGDNFMWFPEKTGSQIHGETTDEWFSKKNAFEVSEFDFQVNSSEATEGVSAKGSAAGKAKFGAITVEKVVDAASVPLYKACSKGTIFPSAMLAIRAPGGSHLLYLQYIFRYNQITGITWSGGGGDKRPKEKLTFTFKAMGVQYIQQHADGREGTKQTWSWNTVDQGVSSLDIEGIDGPPSYEAGTQPKVK